MKCHKVHSLEELKGKSIWTNKRNTGLFDIYKKEDKAFEIYEYFLTDEFISRFGNWLPSKELDKNTVESNRVDDNGFPKIFKYDNSKNQYYVIDKKGDKFPLEYTGLYTFFSTENLQPLIKETSKYILNKYIGDSFNISDLMDKEISFSNDIKEFLNIQIGKVDEELEDYTSEYDNIYDSGNEKRIEELEKNIDSLDEVAGNLLLIEENIDEYIDEIANYFKAIGLDLKKSKNIKTDEEYSDIQETDESEVDIREGVSWGKASFERNLKKDIDDDIKIILSFIPANKSDNIFGVNTYLDYDAAYNFVQKNVANLVSTEKEDGSLSSRFDNALKKLKELSYANFGREEYKYLVKILDNFTDKQKVSFNRLIQSKINFLVTEIDTNNKKYSIFNVSEANSVPNQIVNKWGTTFKDKFAPNNKPQFPAIKKKRYEFITFRDNDLKPFLKYITFNENIEDKEYYEKLNNVFNKYVNLLRSIGVDVTDKGLFIYLNGISQDLKSKEEIRASLVNMVDNTIRLFDGLVDKNAKNRIDLIVDKTFVNPFSTSNQTLFLNLAKAEALFNEDYFEKMVISGNKQYYTYSNFNNLSLTTEIWKQNVKEAEKQFAYPYSNDSVYLRHLLAYDEVDTLKSDKERLELAKRRLEEFKVYTFNHFNEKGKSSFATDAKDTKLIDFLSDYINKVLQPVIGKQGYINTSTPVDKKTLMSFSIPKFFNSKLKITPNGDVKISREVVDIFVNYYDNELKRAAIAYEEISMVENAKDDKERKESLKSIFVNHHVKKIDGKWVSRDSDGKLVGNAFKSNYFDSLTLNKNLLLFNEFNEPTYTPTDFLTEKQRTEVYPIIESFILKLIENNRNKLIENGVFREVIKKNKGEKVSVIDNNTLDSTIFNKYKEKYKENASLYLTSDFTINTLISHIEYSKMFMGDVSYYKNKNDYKTRVPGSYTDGNILSLGEHNENDRFFNIAITDSIEIKSPYLEELKKDLGNKQYSELYDSTDAQSWITPERWKFLTKRLRQWTPDHEVVYKYITDTKITKPLTKKQLKLSAQALKGVYFGKHSNGAPIYLKYSQFVLSDRIVQGNKMQNVLDNMRKNNIDELVVTSAVKTGATYPDKISDEDGNILDDLSFNSIQLDNRYWKEQQELPTKGIKDTLISSQLQKNIFYGLAFNLDNIFSVDDKSFSTADMIKEIHSVLGRLSDIGVEKIMQSFGIDSNFRITDISSFYKSILEEYKTRNNDENIELALMKEMTPAAIIQAYPKLMNTIFAKITKEVVKIKTNGAGFIQTSSFGFEQLSMKTQRGIKWFIDPEKGLKPPMFVRYNKDIHEYGSKTINGIKYALNKDKKRYIQGGQILISYSNAEKIFGKDVDITKINQDLLKVIGYRIPNQGLSSNAPLEIVGILPDGHGDAVIAYSEIVKQTGSDFDIDKMYLMLPNLTYNKKSKKYEYVEMQRDVEGNVKELGEQSEAAIQNYLIKLFHSVLTNEHSLNPLLNPVDEEYFKDFLDVINEKQSSLPLDNFNGVTQLLDRYNYIGGQASIGQIANSLVDNIIGQSIGMTLNRVNLGIGNIVNNETIFDKEFSEELTKEEIDEYVKLAEKEGKKVDKEYIKKFYISKTIGVILNPNVDIKKNPFIAIGNWNTHTNNTGIMLVRAGVHPYKVASFLQQPIIKDYIKDVNKSEGKSVNQNSRYSINRIVEKYKNKLLEGKDKKIHKDILKAANYEIYSKKISDFSLTSLNNNLNRESFDDKFYIEQLSLLNIYEKLLDYSKGLRNAVFTSKNDTEGVFSNPVELMMHRNNISNVISDNLNDKEGAIRNFEMKFFRDGYYTASGTYFKNSTVFMQNLIKNNPDLFILGKDIIEDKFNDISISISNGLLTTPALGKKLNNAMYTYILSGFKPFASYNLDDIYNDLFIPLAEDIKKLQNNKKVNNFFIDNLTPIEFKNTTYFGINSRDASPYFKNTMYRAFKDLFLHYPSVAEKLVVASFYQSGFNSKLNSIHSFIPHEWFIEKQLTTYFKEIDLQHVIDNFDSHFFRHNWNDFTIVPQIYNKNVKAISKEELALNQIAKLELPIGIHTIDNKGVGHNGIIINNYKYGNKVYNNLNNKDSYVIKYRPFVLLEGRERGDGIKGNDRLFQLVGYTNRGYGIYFQTFKEGNRNIHEYSFNKKNKSIIKDNNPLLLQKNNNYYKELYDIYKKSDLFVNKEEYESTYITQVEKHELLDYIHQGVRPIKNILPFMNDNEGEKKEIIKANSTIKTVEEYSDGKTQSPNVTIVDSTFVDSKDVERPEIFKEAWNKDKITAYRVSKKTSLLESFKRWNAIGNPFAVDKYGEGKATEMFLEWLTTDKYDKLTNEDVKTFENNLKKEYIDKNGLPKDKIFDDFKKVLKFSKEDYLLYKYKQALVDAFKSGELKGKEILYYKELGRPSHATVIDYLANVYDWDNEKSKKENNTSNINIEDITLNSGGAYGADTEWDLIGREFGLKTINHFRDSANANLSKRLKSKGIKAAALSKEQMNKARQEIKDLLGIEYKDDLRGNLQVRNYYQVSNSDGVFAIATLKNDKAVTGGTNTAVQLGIKLNKEVHVFDIITEKWYQFSKKQNKFIEENTPVLTKTFAGIGSRDIENYNTFNNETKKWEPREQYVGDIKRNIAINAIRNVYSNTTKTKVNTPNINKLPGTQLDLFNC